VRLCRDAVRKIRKIRKIMKIMKRRVGLGYSMRLLS